MRRVGKERSKEKQSCVTTRKELCYCVNNATKETITFEPGGKKPICTLAKPISHQCLYMEITSQFLLFILY